MHTQTPKRHTDTFWLRRGLLLLGLLTAFALRLYKLGDQNVWWDEGLSVLAARMSFSKATLWTAADVHPPLYFWLLWLWQRLTGETEFALRAVTVMEALLAAAVVAPLGQRLARNRWVSVGAVWLLALSRFHVWWSQEMRMYVLAGLASLISLYFTARLAADKTRWQDRLGWIVGTAAAMLTVYSSIVLVPIENLFMLVAGLKRRDRWAFWGRWIALQAAMIPLMLPWLALALPRMRSWSVVQEPVSLAFVLELNAVLLTLGISTDVGRYALPAFAVIAVALSGVWLAQRQRAAAQRLWLLALACLLPPLTIWALAQPRGLFYNPRVEARYLLPFAPAFYIFLAWGLVGWLSARRLRPAGVLASLGVAALCGWTLPQHYAPRYLKDDYLSLTQLLWAYGKPDDAVLLVAGDRYALFYPYYDAPTAPVGRPRIYPLPGAPPLNETEVATFLKDIAAQHERLWLAEVERALQDPEGRVEAWLMARYARALSFNFGYNRLSLFSAQSEEPAATNPPPIPLQAALASGVALQGYAQPTHEFRALDQATLLLYLRVTTPTTLTATLIGADGWAAPPATLALPAREGIIVRRVQWPVTLYTPAQRYQIALQAGNGERVLFGNVNITHTERVIQRARIPQPLDATLGNDIRLLGYGLAGVKKSELPTARPGDVLTLDLYWETAAPLTGNYHVFTHFIGAAHNPATNGPLWAQDDQIPLEGAYPTTQWLPGIPLMDRYTLTIAPNAPPGGYQLAVGMYAPEDGARLPVAGNGANPETNSIVLTTVQVTP